MTITNSASGSVDGTVVAGNGASGGGNGAAVGGSLFITGAAVGISAAAGTTTTIANQIYGVSDHGLALSGGGTVALGNANNSYNGVSVSGTGTTLSVSADGDLGGTVALGAGTAIQFTAGGTYSHTVTVTGDPTFDTAGNTVTYSGQISGAGDVNVIGGGTLVLTNTANSYTLGTVVTAGSTVSVNADGELGATSGGLTLGDATTSGTLAATGSFTLASGRTVTLGLGGGIIDTASGKTLTVAGQLTGSGALTVTDTGTLVLGNATNNFTGGTTVQGGGTLSIGADGALGTGGGLTLNNGTLAITTSLASSRTITLAAGGGTINDATGVAATMNGQVTGIGGLTVAGPGTLVLTNSTNNYTGATTISAGTLALSVGGSIASSSGVADSGTFDISALTNGGTSITTLSGAGTVTLGANTLTLSNASSAFSGAINGNGGLTLTTGTEVLTGTNGYTGATTINGGTLLLGVSNAISASSGVNLVAGGTLDVSPAGATITSLAGSGGTVTLGAQTLTLTNAAGTFGGAINGSGGGLTLTTGTETLSGVNFYAGATTINGGTLTLGVSNAISASSGVSLVTGATLDVSTAGATINSLTGTGGAATLGTQTLTLSSASGTFSGAINGSGGLTLAAGTQTLSGTNGYTGATTINGGTLALSGTGSIASSSGVADSGTFDISALTNGGASIKTLSGAGSVQLGANTLTLSNASGTFGGAINGSGGGLTLTTGTETLSGVNGYTGATTINGGTLTLGVSNAISASSGVSLIAGGTLDVSTAGATISSLAGSGGQVTLGTQTLTLSNAAGTFSGAINGSGGGLTLTSGTEALTGTNGYTGATTINGGTLALSGTGSIVSSSGVADSGTFDISGLTNGGASIKSLSGGGIVTLGANTLTLSNASGTFSGAVNGGGGLTLTTGTETLSGTNGYTGATRINGGTLTLGISNAIATSSGVSLVAGATLDVSTAGATIKSLAGTGGTVTLGTQTLTLSNAAGTFGGAINGSGGLTVTAGTETLSGTNGYTGATTIQAGATLLLPGGSISSSSGINLTGSGATFDISSGSPNNQTIKDLAGVAGSFVDLGANILTVGTANSTTFAGTIKLGDGGAVGSLVKVGSGTLTLSGTNGYIGTTDVQAGKLTLNGSLASPSVTVRSGATLGGSGTITNAVTIANGGTLAPGPAAAPGTLAVGSLALSSGSLLAYRLGTAGTVGGATNDLTTVSGALTLAGTLNVTDSGGFGLGSYRIFNYGGALTDNGLAVGTLPAGFTGVVQTGVPGQVNLIAETPGVQVQFWDGATTNGDGTIHGGTGTWNANLNNWTSANGQVNTPWQSGFGILTGTAGTVTATAALTYQGLQFSSDGYVVAASGAGALSPTGQAPIRVDAGVTATISAPITGTGGVVKTDPGKLILSGTNSYAGGTTVNAGTLSVGADANLGAAAGGLTLNGGTLQVTGTSFTSTPRSITFGANGGGFDIAAAANSFTVSQAFAGSGPLAKLGAGTLVLTGANSYTGGTTIAGGTLQLGNGGTTGAITGNVADNGVLAFDRSDSVGFGGVISGTGAVRQMGTGTTLLTAANTYTGGTKLAAGTLGIGNSQALGSGALTMANATTLQFTTSGLSLANAIIFSGGGDPTIDTGANTDTIAGVISGPGALAKIGSGTLILSGTDTYTGATTVTAGTLDVEGSIANSAVTVASGATLAGSGAIGGLTVQSGATLAPGAITPFTTLNVSGSLTFAAGSTFLVNINAAGQTDRLAVTGKATLTGATAHVVAANGVYSPFTRYTILTANGGVNGTFAGLTTTSNLAFLSPLLSYDANDVFLGFTQTLIPPGQPGAGTPVAFSSVAVTRKQASTAAAVQALGLGNPVFNAAVGQTAAGARQAFDALSGEVHASAVTAAFEDSRLPREAILDRLNQPGEPSTLGAAMPMTGAYAADLPSGKGPALAPVSVQMYQPHLFGLWGQGFGNWGHTSTDRNAASLTRDTGGFVAGADVTKNLWNGLFRLGLAGGYTSDSLNVKQRLSSGSFESVFGGLYGGASFGAIELRAGVLYGTNTTSTTRSIIFPNFADAAGSSYGGSTAQAFGELGYRIGLSGFNMGAIGFSRASLEPFFGGAAIHIHQNGFGEAGGAAALIGFGKSYDLETTTLGLRAETTLAGPWPITARAQLGWRHGYGDVVPKALMAFQGGAQGFGIAGVPVDRDAIVAETGLDYSVSSMVTVGVSYSGQYGRRATDSAFKGHVDVSFW